MLAQQKQMARTTKMGDLRGDGGGVPSNVWQIISLIASRVFDTNCPAALERFLEPVSPESLMLIFLGETAGET